MHLVTGGAVYGAVKQGEPFNVLDSVRSALPYVSFSHGVNHQAAQAAQRKTMKRKTLLYILLFAVVYLDVAYIMHLRRVIADRVVYEDAGCRGHYQGEE